MPDFSQNPTKMRARFDASIKVERARRLEVGTDVEVTGYGWVALQGRAEDQAALLGLNSSAQTLIAMNDNRSMVFTDRENMMHLLSPQQVVELFMRGAAFVEQVHFAGEVLRAQPSMSIDVTDDQHWPIAGVAP